MAVLQGKIESEAQELARLRAENAQLKADQASSISLKVGSKGTVALYHGSRWPVSLYASQWERIIPYIKSGRIEAFIAAHPEVKRKTLDDLEDESDD